MLAILISVPASPDPHIICVHLDKLDRILSSAGAIWCDFLDLLIFLWKERTVYKCKVLKITENIAGLYIRKRWEVSALRGSEVAVRHQLLNLREFTIPFTN